MNMQKISLIILLTIGYANLFCANYSDGYDNIIMIKDDAKLELSIKGPYPKLLIEVELIVFNKKKCYSCTRAIPLIAVLNDIKIFKDQNSMITIDDITYCLVNYSTKSAQDLIKESREKHLKYLFNRKHKTD